MRVALVSPYSWTYPGGVTRHIEALASRADGDRSRRARAGALRRGHALDGDGARGPPPAGPRGPGVAGRPRRHDRLAGQRRGVEHRDHALLRDDAAARAAHRRLRRGARPRAGRAGARLGRPHGRRRTARRHLPLLLRAHAPARDRDRARRAPQAQPPGRAHRGLRGRRLDRPALLRGRLPGRPQRRDPAAGGRSRAARAPPRASRCGSPSSARPSSARACPCCCAPSRRCARRCRRS